MRRTEIIVHRQNQNRTMSRQNRDVTVVTTAQTKQGWLNVECGAEAPEGAVPDCALAPFLSEDYTKVVKGWRPNVGSADVGQRGFGEASVYWLLDYVELKPPALAIGDQCEVDAIGFVFQKSEGAAMSQKAQRRIAQQKKVEVVWAGPAVVREQSAVSRVSVGHRGATARKALFESGDEGSSDGTGDSSGGGFEGGCSRAENKARQSLRLFEMFAKIHQFSQLDRIRQRWKEGQLRNLCGGVCQRIQMLRFPWWWRWNLREKRRQNDGVKRNWQRCQQQRCQLRMCRACGSCRCGSGGSVCRVSKSGCGVFFRDGHGGGRGNVAGSAGCGESMR